MAARRGRGSVEGGAFAGPLWLLCVAIGTLGIPVLAIVIDDEHLGVFVAMLIVFVPLFWLLAFRGGRADGRVSDRTRHSGRVMLGVGAAGLVLTVVALVVHNPGWVVAAIMTLGSLALAKAWGAFTPPAADGV